MNPLKPIEIPRKEILGTAMGWLDLWRKNDQNTLYITGFDRSPSEAFDALAKHAEKTMQGKTFANEKYIVRRNQIGGGMVHLRIKTLDATTEHNWQEYQQIKNELLGPECEAVELYPAESRLVDAANEYHLWGWSDSVHRFPVGFQSRTAADAPETGSR